jgi:capsular exopolysaccharide synthesis family protein
MSTPQETPNGPASSPGNLLPVPSRSLAGPLELAPPPSALAAAPNAKALLKALRRRWPLALTVGLVVGVGAAVGTSLILPPPKQTARALVKVEMAQPNLVFTRYIRAADFNIYQRDVLAQLKSRVVYNNALNRLRTGDSTKEIPGVDISTFKLFKGHTDDPLLWMEKIVEADYSVGPSNLSIRVSGEDAQELMLVTNAVLDAFVSELNSRHRTKQNDTLDKLNDLLGRNQRRGNAKREQLRALEKRAGSGNLDNLMKKQSIVLDEMAVARRELSQIRTTKRQLEAEVYVLLAHGRAEWPDFAAVLGMWPRPGLPVNLALTGLFHHNDKFMPTYTKTERIDPRDSRVEDALAKDSGLKRLLDRATALQSDLARQKAALRPSKFNKDHSVRKLKKEIKSVQEQLEKARQGIAYRLGEQLRIQARHQNQIAYFQAQSRLDKIKEVERKAKADVKNFDFKARQINDNSLEIEELKDNMMLIDQTIKETSKQIMRVESEKEAANRVTEMSRAEILYADGDTKAIIFPAMAGIGGLFGVLFGFALWEFRSRKIGSPDEIALGLGIRVVGTVPDLAQGRRRLGGSGGGPYGQSVLTESVDAIRTMVLHASRAEKLQVLMVTSAMPGEGKTSLASHLAASLARAGRKTLLVDCDLRNPALHRLFNMETAPGFGELIQGECDMEEAIEETPSPNLWLLPAGECDSLALHALAQEGPQAAFEKLREHFDFIVVDSSPVLPVTDSLLIGQYADGLIFSILNNVSRLPRVYAAYQRLAMLDIRMLGAVVNGAQDEHAVAGYQYVQPATTSA